MSHSYLGQSGNMTFKKQISDRLLKSRSTTTIKSLSHVFKQPYFLSPPRIRVEGLGGEKKACAKLGRRNK